jgi:hypothetical protein
MRLVMAFVVFLCGPASEAMSQEIPDYDTEAFCEQRAGGKAPNNRRFASCLTMEKLALDQIEDYWPEASETIRSVSRSTGTWVSCSSATPPISGVPSAVYLFSWFPKPDLYPEEVIIAGGRTSFAGCEDSLHSANGVREMRTTFACG